MVHNLVGIAAYNSIQTEKIKAEKIFHHSDYSDIEGHIEEEILLKSENVNAWPTLCAGLFMPPFLQKSLKHF